MLRQCCVEQGGDNAKKKNTLHVVYVILGIQDKEFSSLHLSLKLLIPYYSGLQCSYLGNLQPIAQGGSDRVEGRGSKR